MTPRLTPSLLVVLAVAFTAAASAGVGRRDEDTAILPPQGARLPGTAWRSRARHGQGARRRHGRGGGGKIGRKLRHKHARRPTLDAERTDEIIRVATTTVNGKTITGYAEAPVMAVPHIRDMADNHGLKVLYPYDPTGNKAEYPVFVNDDDAAAALAPAKPTQETAKAGTSGKVRARRDLGMARSRPATWA